MSSSPAVVFSLHVRCLYLGHPHQIQLIDTHETVNYQHLCEHSFHHHVERRHVRRAAWVALDCYIK
ncbi:unnamed protein product [Musa textilis]